MAKTLLFYNKKMNREITACYSFLEQGCDPIAWFKVQVWAHEYDLLAVDGVPVEATNKMTAILASHETEYKDDPSAGRDRGHIPGTIAGPPLFDPFAGYEVTVGGEITRDQYGDGHPLQRIAVLPKWGRE